MLRVFRLRAASALIASILCASVGVMTVGTIAHGDRHDAFPAFVVHDASAHTFEAGSDAITHPLHCLVCHWSRSLRSHPGGVSDAAPSGQDGPRIHSVIDLVTPAALAALPPLRSPPAIA